MYATLLCNIPVSSNHEKHYSLSKEGFFGVYSHFHDLVSRFLESQWVRRISLTPSSYFLFPGVSHPTAQLSPAFLGLALPSDPTEQQIPWLPHQLPSRATARWSVPSPHPTLITLVWKAVRWAFIVFPVFLISFCKQRGSSCQSNYRRLSHLNIIYCSPSILSLYSSNCTTAPNFVLRHLFFHHIWLVPVWRLGSVLSQRRLACLFLASDMTSFQYQHHHGTCHPAPLT